MSQQFSLEEQVAVSAVRRACHLTASVFNKLSQGESTTKEDKSPVTIADYAAQAVISSILHTAFPSDAIVAEEDASSLRSPTPTPTPLLTRILSLTNTSLRAPLTLGDDPTWGVGPSHTPHTPSSLLTTLDLGTHPGGLSQGRMWTIDPIDGTKGFLRGGQFAVCVSLIVDGRVSVGVIGCPNLPVDAGREADSLDSVSPDERGVMFVAVQGRGAYQSTISGSDPNPLQIPTLPSPSQTPTPNPLHLLESHDPSHSSHTFNATLSSLLHITRPPIRMDSQAKYGCVARSQGGAVYMRMPTKAGYREKIWDHAPGTLIISESGGVVSDSRGLPLDFTKGRTLGENHGVVACGRGVHGEVVDAVGRALEKEKEGEGEGEKAKA